MDIIISGVNGFVGNHLVHELISPGHSVSGIGREPQATASLSGVLSNYFSCDLTDSWPDTKEVDVVIHLAGLAAVGPSFDNPQQYINLNSAMVTNMGEYYLTQDHKPRIIIVSSGAVYSSDQAMPISEDGKVAFSSPYAVSKVLVEHQAAYYRSRGLDCVIARPFNHIGPGQGKGFILPDFYERIHDSTTNTISVGNIETKRDYTDVRDIVKAYVALAMAPYLKHMLYNICSGQSLSGSEILHKLTDAMQRPDITFQVDQSLVRPTDIPEIVGDSSRLQNELDWKPTYTIDQTVKDFVDMHTT